MSVCVFCVLLDCEQTRRRQQLTRLHWRCVGNANARLKRSPRFLERNAKNFQPTPAPQRERRQTVPIFQSNQTGGDGDLFVTLFSFFFFYYRPVLELFLSLPLSSFFSNFLGNVLLPCVYAIKLESRLPT